MNHSASAVAAIYGFFSFQLRKRVSHGMELCLDAWFLFEEIPFPVCNLSVLIDRRYACTYNVTMSGRFDVISSDSTQLQAAYIFVVVFFRAYYG